MNRRAFLRAAGTAPIAAAFARRFCLAGQSSQIDQVFARSIVFDALSADQEWDAQTFDAARVSGLSAIHTSLSNRNFAVAMKDLALEDCMV